jgi:hypothetical protein
LTDGFRAHLLAEVVLGHVHQEVNPLLDLCLRQSADDHYPQSPLGLPLRQPSQYLHGTLVTLRP